MVMVALVCLNIIWHAMNIKKGELSSLRENEKDWWVFGVIRIDTRIDMATIFLLFYLIFLFFLVEPSLDTIRLSWRNGLQISTLFVCWKVVFFWKVNSEKMNSGKMNYFSMFGSVMENKLENTLQCLDMSWKMSWKITY